MTIEEEEAGVHFLMHLCTDQKEEKIVTQAKSRGVKLKPLSGYYADTAEAAKQENTYVMNYSSIDPAAMERAAKCCFIFSEYLADDLRNEKNRKDWVAGCRE